MKNTIFFLLLILVLIACKKEQEILTPTPTISTTTFTLTFENVMQNLTFFQSGTTDLIQPEESKTYTFLAGIGMHLSLATMLVQSNDLFYGFEDAGLPLYDEAGVAITGDITHAIQLWDAGTEVNEVLGEGNSQAPRQESVNSGEREDGLIQLVDSLNDGLIYPAVDSMIQVSIAYNGNNQFVLTIKNISTPENMVSDLAPGVFTIHQKGNHLFQANEKASAGLEALAEDGDNSILSAQLLKETGFSSIIGTGIYIVHKTGNPIYTNGTQDRGHGLEVLAEYGNPENLHTFLKGDSSFSEIGVFNNPVGNNVLNLGGKLVPGDKYVFSFEANSGDYLSIANMLVETNDLFFGFGDGGLELFPNNIPISGDVTAKIELWDAGTEANEYPGVGGFQPLRNGGKEGIDEGGIVQLVNDEFTYPAVNELVRVSIKWE